MALVILIAAAAASGSAEAAGTSAGSPSPTGGFRYDPEPGIQPEDGRLGAIPRSGGSPYDPSARRRTTRLRRRQASRRRSRVVPPNQSVPIRSSSLHAFPVQGEHSYGGADGRFGARRPGHIHQGQDILAAEGTPVVAPRGGVVTWRAFQAQGAGYYMVVDAVDEPYNYVFMHLQRGSVGVDVGQRVRTGESLARVGSTGTATAPHLHFEVWLGPWFHGGHPIDPLPLLQAWDAVS